MKKLNVLILAGATAAAFAFQACNSSNKPNSTEAAMDSNSNKDTSSMMSSSTDTAAKGAMNGVMKVDKDDSQFAVEAANGGMAEVAMGKLAEQKGMTQSVKDFGAKMVKDHGMANDKLKALAKQKDITLPDSLGNDAKQKMMDLSKKTGKDFDKAYVSEMVSDHDHDVNAFEKEAKNATDPDIKAFAANTLPTLKEHQAMIKSIQSKMK